MSQNTATATRCAAVSRAVLRRIEPGNLAVCITCGQPVKFAAKLHKMQVIANVYVDGRWNRVEHFHDECYAEADAPYGDAGKPLENKRSSS
jgi:threonine synthase